MDTPPVEFDQHIEHLTALINEVEDPELRVAIFESVETLTAGLNQQWVGCRVAWPAPVPDDISFLF